MRQLGKRFEKNPFVAVVILHLREPHAGQLGFRDIAQPTTFEERRILAERCRVEFELPLPILIDGMDDASRALLGDLPSPAFIIDPSGVIRDKLPWGDATAIERSLERLAKEDFLAPPANAERGAESSLAGVRDRARRALVAGTPNEALTMLRAALATPPEKPSPDSSSLLAELRTLVAIAAEAAGAEDAATLVGAARTALGSEAPFDTALRAALLVELAGAIRQPAVRREVYREARNALQPGAPDAMRRWLDARTASPDAPPPPR